MKKTILLSTLCVLLVAACTTPGKRTAIGAGAGAAVPLTGFGNTLAKGVKNAVGESGLLGAFTGGLSASAGGVSAAVIFGLLTALLSRPKDKK